MRCINMSRIGTTSSKPTGVPPPAPTVLPSAHLAGEDSNQETSRSPEEFCDGCWNNSDQIKDHLQKCPWTPEVESLRRWLREMFYGLVNDEKKWLKDWIAVYRQGHALRLRWLCEILIDLDDVGRDWVEENLLSGGTDEG